MNFETMSLMTDFYELTMMQGYLNDGSINKTVVFDVFYRVNPSGNGFAITAGLEQVIDYIKNLHFSESDIEYLRSLNTFDEKFLTYLKGFRFTGDIYAIPEGTVVFPTEPLLRVKAPIMEAQIVETAILTIINHQSLIATKASRVAWSAGNDAVMEFGLRRAQGPDAGIYGARAAIIGGCAGTSNVLTGKMFDVPVLGTHAHSWVMSFPSEVEAFRCYARTFPNACTFLVDTYDTLRSGVPNAIKVFKEMQEAGIELKNYGIRLDSGDLAYLSKEARKMLDDAGLTECTITASNALDEYLIRDLMMQGAQVDTFGVGERLITSSSSPVFGGVYKLVAVENDGGEIVPKIKVSENTTKITNPHFKKVYRYFDKDSGKAIADELCIYDEVVDDSKPRTIFDPNAVWKTKMLDNYTAKELLVPIFKNGKCVYESPSIEEIATYCREQIDLLWDEVKRFENPHNYYVDLSKKLYDIKALLLNIYEK